jgi:hypothetical protein
VTVTAPSSKIRVDISVESGRPRGNHIAEGRNTRNTNAYDE